MSPTNAHWRPLIIVILFALCLAEKLTPLLPGDPYNVVGEIEWRQLGRCNYSYAWLAIPTGSHQDIYAHAAACSRLELRFLEFEAAPHLFPRDTNSLSRVRDHDYNRVSVDDELNRVNKDYASQLVDLATLDALLVAVKVEEGVQSNPPLTKDDRFFYLADRLGQYKMLAMLRPGRLPKIEVIPPPSQKAHFYPRFVLCYRKICLEPPVIPSADNQKTIKHVGNGNASTTISPSAISNEYTQQQLTALNQENRRLYMQVIIYRAVFALTAFLCLVFGIIALILCIRLRKSRKLRNKGPPRSDAGNSYHATQIPTGFYINGKPGYPTSSPLVYTDQGGSLNVAHMHSDTASLHNTALSSNLSNCELMAASGVTVANYPAFVYATDSGIPVRQLINGGQNMFMRSISPASSSMHLEPVQGFRANSLDRRSSEHPDTPCRRTPLQVNPHNPESQFPIIRPYSGYTPNFKTVNSSPDHTMASQGSAGTVIHRFSTDNGYPYTLNPIVSNNGDAHATQKV